MDYLSINRQTWNDKTDVHFQSEFYDTAGFIGGRSSLNSIELELLGDIRGKSVLHLQCHFGQDTISLERMGATVMGVDFSEKAIEKARELAAATGSAATFVCCNVYDAPQHIHQKFDIVFTSYGTTGWLPNIDQWAAVVAQFLKPNGKFVFAEFHPVMWMYDNDFKEVTYSYFHGDAIVEQETGTYADKNAPIEQVSVTWNHGMGEVISSLLRQHLTLTSLQEFNYSPYNAFNGSEEIAPGKFVVKAFGDKIPLVYALTAVAPPIAEA